MDLLFALEFYNNPAINQQVCSKAAFQFNPIVDNGHGLLTNDSQTTSLQFVSKADFVRGLKQARSEASVNLDSRPDDPLGHLEHRQLRRAVLKEGFVTLSAMFRN
jgi:hypothetical protein